MSNVKDTKCSEYHEHSDHKDFICVVSIDYEGSNPSKGEVINGLGEIEYVPYIAEEVNHPKHALIYYDGNIAVTLYECTYAMWSLKKKTCIGSTLDWTDFKLNLTAEQIEMLNNRTDN